jgi:hypothetical protein
MPRQKTNETCREDEQLQIFLSPCWGALGVAAQFLCDFVMEHPVNDGSANSGSFRK